MGCAVVIICQPLHQSSYFVKIETKSSVGRVFDQRKAFMGSQLLGVAPLASLIYCCYKQKVKMAQKTQKKL